MSVKTCRLALITIAIELWPVPLIEVDVFLVGAENSTDWLRLILGWLLTGQFRFLIEVGQSFEEAENFGFGEDVRENAEVDAELLEALEVHLEATIGVELIECQHGLVNNAKHINDALILQNLE